MIHNIVSEFISVLIFNNQAIHLQGEIAMSEKIFQACKELVDDAKTGCADMVFKEVVLEILSRARSVLTPKQFKQLVAYAADRMEEKIPFELQQKLMATR